MEACSNIMPDGSIWALAPDDRVEAMLERVEDTLKEWLFALYESLKHDLFDRLVVTLWTI